MTCTLWDKICLECCKPALWHNDPSVFKKFATISRSALMLRSTLRWLGLLSINLSNHLGVRNSKRFAPTCASYQTTESRRDPQFKRCACWAHMLYQQVYCYRDDRMFRMPDALRMSLLQWSRHWGRRHALCAASNTDNVTNLKMDEGVKRAVCMDKMWSRYGRWSVKGP